MMYLEIQFLVLISLIRPGLPTASNSQGAALSEMMDAFRQWKIQEIPEMATLVNDHSQDRRLTRLSIGAYNMRKQHAENVLKKLKNIGNSKLSQADELQFRLFVRYIQEFVDGYKWRHYGAYNAINFLENILDNFNAFLIDAMPFKTNLDFVKYCDRLVAIQGVVDDMIETMSAAVVRGTTLHNVSIVPVLDKLDDVIESPANQTFFFRPYLNFATNVEEWTDPALKKEAFWEIVDIIDTYVKPALLKLRNFIVRDYLPHTRLHIGVSSLPEGEAYYRACLNWHLTEEREPRDVHELGLREVARIRLLMEEIMREDQFSGTLAEYTTHLLEDSRFKQASGEAILEAYRKLIFDRIQPALSGYFTVMPTAELRLTPLPFDGPGGMYMPAAADGSRPGIFFLNIKHDQPTFGMVALAIHEAIPGHHFQLSTAAQIPNIPKYRVDGNSWGLILSVPFEFPSYTAYAEGWALYAEYLGEEMGVYHDRYERFGRLSEEIFRATRLVVDTGIHVFNWTRDQAIDYMFDNNCQPRSALVVEVDRYITWPGQACAYKIGELKIKELRQRAENKLGGDFRVDKFHDAILGLGSVPLDIMEKHVDKWIKQIQEGNGD